MTTTEMDASNAGGVGGDSPPPSSSSSRHSEVDVREKEFTAEDENFVENPDDVDDGGAGNDKETPASSLSLAAAADEESARPDGYPLPVGDVTCWRLVRSPRDLVRLTWGWMRLNKNQCLSGITVALAQIPEAVSFSFVAGVDPIVGLQSAWIMGIMTSLFGGRPGMVAGATGAVAVVLTNLVKNYGIGYMFYAIMLAGIVQMAFGLCRLGVLIRMVPHPVMVGFCNGLGIVIGTAQFNIFKVRPDDASAGGGHRRLVSLFGAFDPFTNGYPWVDPVTGAWMGFQIVVTLLVYIVFPRFSKAIPGSLAAIIVSTALEWALIRPLGFATNTVSDLASVAGAFPSPVWVDTRYGYAEMMPPLTGQVIGVIFPTAITAAIIGLLESLLTLQLIDDMTNTKGNSNREAFGQGLGQFLSGAFGGMGGCTTIGQSMMNIHSGGYTRLSSSVAAAFMLLIILVAYPLINLIPVASLAGVMFVVTYFTIEWESGLVMLGALLPMRYREKFGLITKVKRSDVAIMVVVVAVTLILDLAVAVGCGIVLACLVFSWDAGTRLGLDRTVSEDGTEVYYAVSGPIFFGSVKPLMDLFPDPRREPRSATVLLENAEIYDWSGMMAVKALHDRFENNGVTVKFQKLTASSHRLMHKGAHLWEGVNVYAEDEAAVDFERDPLVEGHEHHILNPVDAHL